MVRTLFPGSGNLIGASYCGFVLGTGSVALDLALRENLAESQDFGPRFGKITQLTSFRAALSSD